MKKIAVNNKAFTPEKRKEEKRKENRKNKSFDELTDFVEVLESRIEKLEAALKSKPV